MKALQHAAFGILALPASGLGVHAYADPAVAPDKTRPEQALVSAPTQDFIADAPGTYALPAIEPAGNGWVLEDNYWPRRLSNYTYDAVTLLSFIYTYCIDPIGCPLAYATMADLRSRVLADTSLRGKVRFVSLSFDPTNDTPEAMHSYGSDYADSTALPWHFLTTYSTHFLLPILDSYGQDVAVELDTAGRPTRTRTHMLKLFLIDPHSEVREIYSAAFLLPEVMYNDIKTLAMESDTPLAATSKQIANP